MNEWNNPKYSDFVLIDDNLNKLYLTKSKLSELDYFKTYFESEIGNKSSMGVENISVCDKLLSTYFQGNRITVDFLSQFDYDELFCFISLVFEWLFPNEYKEIIFIYIDKNLNKILSEDSSYGILIYNYFGDFTCKVYDKKSKDKYKDTYSKLNGKSLTNKIILYINLNCTIVDECYIDSVLSKFLRYNIYLESCFLHQRYDKIKDHPEYLKQIEYKLFKYRLNEMIVKYFSTTTEEIFEFLNDIYADQAIKLCIKFGKYDLMNKINNHYPYINDYLYISNYLDQIGWNKEYLFDKNIIKIIDPYLYAKMCIELNSINKLINIRSYWTSIQKAFQDHYNSKNNIFTKSQLDAILSASNIISYEDVYLTGDKVLRLSSFYPFNGDLAILVGEIKQIDKDIIFVIPKRSIKINDILLYEGLEYTVVKVKILDHVCKITIDQIIIRGNTEVYNLYKIEEI